ncbi:single-stranded-DNA-specific exonuclease RecJ [Candidatus Palibaumannia cicadellinicola]|uniref:Single-stranded-DNA-specific exonuclease RecJ n=1 Tax=Candidatus Palibaumannia cicadellinicola TaxID=186490 RepID=A0A0K2BL18_9GAMM|nr:single-stranded-DNA-specific exonuclease RecJ [Candidatus Baumannia cicadellinicola]AKZ65748.1 Single-stranded-DNA-specific exonuclease RecJ [Candidatus Baumannia cicadellinicola]
MFKNYLKVNETHLCRRPLGNISVLSNLNIPPLLKQLYIQRGITKPCELELNIDKLLNYSTITGIEQAAIILAQAIIDKLNILIVGDYDTDGATSTALVLLSLKKMGAKNINFIIPKRFEEHHGISPAIVEQALLLNTKIIITVDNGISSYDGVNLASSKGINVLITDHHLPSNKLPLAAAIVNPNLDSCLFPSKALAGVGVTFYLMLALRAQLYELGWFSKNSIVIPNLVNLLDLVALGTIADMVPLDTNNRILVFQGIRRIRAGYCCPGIIALAQVAKVNINTLCEHDLSFAISPRLNAAGRIDDMSLGVTLLTTNNMSKAIILAKQLDQLNKTRKKIEQTMEIQALELCKEIEYKKGDIPLGLSLYHPKWHHGIIGILASRLKKKFNRPVITFASTSLNLVKGSCRSIEGVNIYQILNKLNLRYPGMILQFGGHAMAAGLTLEEQKLKIFTNRFENIIKKIIVPSMLKNIIWSDGELTNDQLSILTAKIIKNGGPWGENFSYPLFDGEFIILNQQIINKKHLIMKLKPITNGPLVSGIIFNMTNFIKLNCKQNKIKLAYQLNINNFYGKSNLQLLIQYFWKI